jgi:hypothetical protein
MRCQSAFRSYRKMFALVGCLSLLSSPLASAEGLPLPIARTIIHPLFVHWQPQVSYQRLTLNVAIPDGRVVQQEFQPGESIGFSLNDGQHSALPDGQYTYELVVTPQLSPAVLDTLRKAQETGDHSQREALQRQGVLPRRPLTQTGYFSVLGGSIVMPLDAE